MNMETAKIPRLRLRRGRSNCRHSYAYQLETLHLMKHPILELSGVFIEQMLKIIVA